MRLVASHHGISEKSEIENNWPIAYEWYEKAILPIEKGGLAIRNMGVVALNAFACSLAASLKHMATIFPEWITLGQQGSLLQISHDASPELSAQVLQYAQQYQRRVPQGVFKESDCFPAILKTIVDLESSDATAPRETQSQGSSQSPSSCREGLRSIRSRTSQAVLYSDFVKEELQRLLARAKARVDASYEVGYHHERVRYRNWLSSINDDSGAWLMAGTSPKMFEMSNREFVSAICRRNTVEDPTIP